MSEPFIGEIRMVGFNFAPRGWAFCQGQILAIAQYTPLFALIGTTFGGDGITTFGLPDMRGRVPVGEGSGPGLSTVTWGERSGTENTTLTINQMPMHNHVATSTLKATSTPASTGNPSNSALALSRSVSTYAPGASNPAFDLAANAGSISTAIGIAGGNQPFNNMQPFLGLFFIIALEGIFPSRN